MRLQLRLAGICGLAFLLRATPVAAQANNVILACVDKNGDVRIVDPGEPCRHNETRIRWNVVGPTGPAGAPGPAGPAGPQGPQGAAGPQGPIGPAGATGATGAAGPQGPKGDTGATGAQGAAGPQGAKGDTGAQGPAGSQGAQGVPGSQGPQGLTGPQGLQGLQGDKGETGATGAQGPAGPQGEHGDGFNYRGEFDPNGTYATYDVVVFNGSSFLATAPTNGAPGSDPSWTLIVSKGDTGATGPTGPTGPQGPQGIQGVKGDTGATGGAGAQGPAGRDGGSVTIAAAPAVNCANGGTAITDALQHTQYVCDGKQGLQGPPGAAGSTAILTQTWINPSSFTLPAINCCNTNWVNGSASATIPGTTFSGTTTGGRLLIEATIPIQTTSAAPNVVCQPNIDDNWAGAPLGSASFDNIFQFASTTAYMTVTISRVYPAPLVAGTHSFSLACASNGRNMVFVVPNGVISYSVFELH